MANPTVRGLVYLLVIAGFFAVAWLIGVHFGLPLRNVFYPALVASVLVAAAWEAWRWRRQQGERVDGHRAARGATERPTRKSARATGARRRVVLGAVGSLLMGLGGLLLLWLIVIYVGDAIGARPGPTFFLGLLGTVGFLLFHAHRHRERAEREVAERRRRDRPRIRLPLPSRDRDAAPSDRPAGPQRTKPHPARQSGRLIWVGGIALWLLVAVVILRALSVLGSRFF